MTTVHVAQNSNILLVILVPTHLLSLFNAITETKSAVLLPARTLAMVAQLSEAINSPATRTMCLGAGMPINLSKPMLPYRQAKRLL